MFSEKPAIDEPVETVSVQPAYEWETGSLAALPSGLAKKGLVEPCETGADCQFNTRCSAPSAGSCAHAVCETGDALEEGCSACSAAVCAADPTCCTAVVETDTCAHDPCAIGSSLKTGCNSCVTKICGLYPNCCKGSGSWDATCTAAVATACGNSCECAKGTAYNGRCYHYESSAKKWPSAQSACQGIGGSGSWDLVGIADQDENSFVRSLGDSNSFWIGLAKGSGSSWTWSGGSPSGSWTASKGGLYTNFSSGEPSSSGKNPDSYALMKSGSSGKWEGKTGSDSAGYVCEGRPEKMVKPPEPVHAWSSACVARVASTCGAICDASDPGNTQGRCVARYPGETDSSCTGIDLAVGVPCDGVIPVCNHGQSEAPAGIRIVHFPADSQQYPKTNPSVSDPQMKECRTSEAIRPGECISVKGCPGLTGNREIMVNPGAGLAECSQLDNWSLYSGGNECSAPICAGGSSAAILVKKPVDIIVSIDNSASMEGEIVSVQERINEDLANILAASDIDYRVILVSRYGNVYSSGYDGGVVSDSQYSVCIGSPLSTLDCPTKSAGKTPTLVNSERFFHHSTDIGSNNMWCRLLESYTKADAYPVARSGWTSVAPNGWGAFLREEAFKVLIGITDDDPLATSTTYTHGSKTLARDCPNMLGDASLDGTNDKAGAEDFDTALRTLAPEHFGVLGGERNYIWHSIVGMTGKEDQPLTPSDPVEKRCCRFDRRVDSTCQGSTGARVDDAANSGVGYQYLSILTGGLRYPSCYHDNFDAIFNTVADAVIQQASASCDLALADLESFDPKLASVVYNSVDSSGKDVATKLTRVVDAAACKANAWYYEESNGASMIKLCPTTCSAVQADANARVTAELGCPPNVEASTRTFSYTGTCGFQEGVLWLDLGYKATIPEDGKIEFRVRVAENEASLADAEWVSLAVATSSRANCGLGSGCEIDVFAALGDPNATLPITELEVTLTPATSGSTVSLDSWELTYTCQDDE